MKSHPQLALLSFLPTVLVVVWLAPQCARAQTQNG